ncbi:hypothetical protein [Dyadobacter alkalitolerans]|nr:hypothetical protein [Dyadobacter alkalitolerans]
MKTHFAILLSIFFFKAALRDPVAISRKHLADVRFTKKLNK